MVDLLHNWGIWRKCLRFPMVVMTSPRASARKAMGVAQVVKTRILQSAFSRSLGQTSSNPLKMAPGFSSPDHTGVAVPARYPGRQPGPSPRPVAGSSPVPRNDNPWPGSPRSGYLSVWVNRGPATLSSATPLLRASGTLLDARCEARCRTTRRQRKPADRIAVPVFEAANWPERYRRRGRARACRYRSSTSASRRSARRPRPPPS